VGDRIVLWDIDPQDWRRPGVTAISQNVLQAVEPGDTILLHDGGGDRSQTVLALEIILRELSEEGYTFEAICR
jgi:peptidoglycan/xylan/chitin deacetylase (PgdA/CDA1 family)